MGGVATNENQTSSDAFQFVGVLLGAFLLALIASGVSLRFEEEEQLAAVFPVSMSQRRSPPEYTKGVYLTAWTAASPAQRAKILALLERSGLNTIVIDVKDDSGKIAYPSRLPFVLQHNLVSGGIEDLQELLASLRNKHIWTIARLVVFQDPALAEARPDLAIRSKRTGEAWKNRKGIAWVDPSAREVWDYNAAIAEEALRLGFDEIQLDYIRFPSDGDLQDLSYAVWDQSRTKHEVIASFFAFFRRQLRREAILSADLFGMTFVKTNDPGDDLGIGQLLSDAIPYFDYISPMVYPSHYSSGFEGFANPALYPYEVVSRTLAYAASHLEGKNVRVRPWLQDFHLGARYTPAMVRMQIEAAEKQGAAGWLLWNPANRYTEEALRVP